VGQPVHAGKRIISQGIGGSMVAVASVDGIAAASFHVAYGAAKAGVMSLAKTFADELGVVRNLRAQGMTVVLVEQSLNIAAELWERAVFMAKGALRFEGTPRADAPATTSPAPSSSELLSRRKR
jgi:NAD(P)-dependent dehydrogenase (short-subunit alcohol dehydrogenase family)